MRQADIKLQALALPEVRLAYFSRTQIIKSPSDQRYRIRLEVSEQMILVH